MSKRNIKYMVRCPYCDKSYTMETKHGEDFCCPTCGGAATTKDAVKIEETASDAKQERKNVFANKWMKLDRPSWFGEDKKLPTEELDYEYSTDGEKTEKAYEIFIFFVAIILLMLRIWLESY